MKHTCGIYGDLGAVAPLDGHCEACNIKLDTVWSHRYIDEEGFDRNMNKDLSDTFANQEKLGVSKNKELLITISGKAKAGKTTVKYIIQQALLDNGIDCEVQDREGDLDSVGKTLTSRVIKLRNDGFKVYLGESQLNKGTSAQREIWMLR